MDDQDVDQDNDADFEHPCVNDHGAEGVVERDRANGDGTDWFCTDCDSEP